MSYKEVGLSVFLRVFIFVFPVFILNGCSEIYRYHPPAPIYGENEATNPYAKKLIVKPVAPIHSSVVNRKYPHDSPRNIGTNRTATLNKSIKRNTKAAKKVLSPAVLALISEADRSSKAGKLESAVATIERALRIDARNPVLTYKLALLRLKQSKPRLAEDLAKKAALLSVNDKHLKKQSWLLISEARRRQNNLYGANEAKLKAGRL